MIPQAAELRFHKANPGKRKESARGRMTESYRLSFEEACALADAHVAALQDEDINPKDNPTFH